MGYYRDIYSQRLDRYGHYLQQRIQKKREKQFQLYLKKTVYLTYFKYDDEIHAGSLQPNKQDYTSTSSYLLTNINLNIPAGTILMLPNKDHIQQPWMIWWLEQIKASGYNRYTILKMSHLINWSYNGVDYSQWAYFRGPGKTQMNDMTKGRRMGGSAYSENNNLYMFITSANQNIDKDVYFQILDQKIPQSYRITDFDLTSTPGVGYYSVDPIYIYDKSEKPQQRQSDSNEDFYWLNGGDIDGGT